MSVEFTSEAWGVIGRLDAAGFNEVKRHISQLAASVEAQPAPPDNTPVHTQVSGFDIEYAVVRSLARLQVIAIRKREAPTD